MEIVRIPEERMSALIGRKGYVKRSIEKATSTAIEITDIVTITGEDPLLVLKAKDMVRAVGRGFSPAQAKRLLEDECDLHVISLQGENPKRRQRMLGRVIGNEGRAKKRIEEETGAIICIKGKTLSIIGNPDELGPAEEALEELLSGKTHAYAYKVMRLKKARS